MMQIIIGLMAGLAAVGLFAAIWHSMSTPDTGRPARKLLIGSLLVFAGAFALAMLGVLASCGAIP